ncbi:MAG: TCR/Tet family MFS transporter [Proteobacteria bacterium]|nr:TCR/Tet family MFS transporter [Pseudomonadota bacterium]
MDSVGFGIIIPVLPDLIMQISGENLAAAAGYGGWLMFAYAVMQFFFAPVLGNLSDAYGRRPVLLLSMLVLSVNYLIMGFADSLVLLFVGRLISGIGASTMSTCNAYIADVTPAEERAQYFGLMGAAFGMGFIIGPVIGGLLGEYGPRIPFIAAACLLFLNLIFGFLILPESLNKESRRKFKLVRANPFATFIQLSKFKVVFGILSVMFIVNLGHHVMPAIWSFYTIEQFDWSSREIGYSLGFVGFLMVFVQGFLIRIVIPKIGMRWAGIIGLTAAIISFAGYAGASASWMLYAAMIPGALGGLAGPAMNGIASTQIGPTQQGQLQGGMSSMMSLTSILSPPIMTQTFGYFSTANAVIYFPGAPFILAGILAVLALVLFIKTTTDLPVARQAS